MPKVVLPKASCYRKIVPLVAFFISAASCLEADGQNNNKKKPAASRPPAKINLPTQRKGSSVRIKIAPVDPQREDEVK